MADGASLQQVREDLRSYLKFLERSGFLYLVPRPSAGDMPGASAHERAAKLEALRVVAAPCTKCCLSEGRTYVVFGEGNPDADILFVGEAPGADEDRQARPFVGRAGQHAHVAHHAGGAAARGRLHREPDQVPPSGNRDPLPDEIEMCEPYLWGQIELIQPRVIVALGRFAAHALTHTQTPISQMRGRFYRYRDVPLMPTLHPAALLRNMTPLPQVLEDLRRAVAASVQPSLAEPTQP